MQSMTIQRGRVPRSSIAACNVSTMRRYKYTAAQPTIWAPPFYVPGKNGGPKNASLSHQMLQTSVVLNQFKGVGASFPPVVTPTWHLQVAQVP